MRLIKSRPGPLQSSKEEIVCQNGSAKLIFHVGGVFQVQSRRDGIAIPPHCRNLDLQVGLPTGKYCQYSPISALYPLERSPSFTGNLGVS